ncbi:MAG TPA: DUF4134 family protein [Puia sp.]|jgi:hypothetical protein|nr:DUF4134 family protein [Puia sp.]
MLHFLSWHSFICTILLMTAVYYSIIGVRFYKKEIRAFIQRYRKKLLLLLPATVGLVVSLHAQTADGNNGIGQANTLIRGYFSTATTLMYGVGGLVGLIGAIRVFILWNGGHREEVRTAAAAWFGSCIFLVVVATIIQAFFGL